MSSQETFNVAVTGNAPFMEFDYNTSLLYARVTRDTYEDVRRVSKEIWGGQRALFLPEPQAGEKEGDFDISLIVHLGMVALGWRTDQFRFETVARRDGYELAGDDGQYVDSDQLKELGLPKTLATSFDVDAAWRKVKENYPDTPSCVSDDAGLYFCEFRMYSSLAEPRLIESYREKSGRVVFVHLPQAHNPEAIALARDITVTYITGLVDSHMVKGEISSL